MGSQSIVGLDRFGDQAGRWPFLRGSSICPK
jgi:hypothetical protein